MVMTSFNALNGIPSAGNKRLVKGILREEWGFDGVVISDYDAVLEMRAHGYCETERDCAEKAMNATTDIEMMPASYLHCIPDLLKEGRLPMCRVDDAVRRVLQLKENLGLFDDPYRAASAAEEEGISVFRVSGIYFLKPKCFMPRAAREILRRMIVRGYGKRLRWRNPATRLSCASGKPPECPARRLRALNCG